MEGGREGGRVEGGREWREGGRHTKLLGIGQERVDRSIWRSRTVYNQAISKLCDPMYHILSTGPGLPCLWCYSSQTDFLLWDTLQ